MRINIVIILTLLSFQAFGQYDSEGKNTSRFRPGVFWYLTGYHPAKPGKLHKYDRLILDVTYNDWTGDRKMFQNNWASIGLNTNLMFDIPLVKKNLVSIGVGGCYGFQTVRHNQDVFMNIDSKWTVISDSVAYGNFERNSLIGHNFSIPIELRFRTNGWRHFKVHIGGKIGYQARLYGKTRGVFEDDAFKFRTNIPDINRWTYSAHVRIGIRNWAFYAQYNFNKLFSNPKSTQLNSLQFGVSVSIF